MKKIMQTIRITQERIDTEEPYFCTNSSQKTGEFLQRKIGNLTSEVLIVLALNTKNEVTGYYEAFKGSLNQSVAHPRDILQYALLSNAAGILIAHNHPSGKLTPSNNDKRFTDRIYECCELMGINFIDHIIVTEKEYLSFREEHMIR